MFRKSVIKGVKFLYGIAVALVVTAAFAGALSSLGRLAGAREVVRLVELERVLFVAAAEIRNEIGTIGVALLADEKADEAVATTLDRVGDLVAATRKGVEANDFAGRDEGLDAIDTASRLLNKTDALVSTEAARQIGQRDVANIEPWRQAIYTVATAFAQNSSTIDTRLTRLNPELAELLSIRRFSYAIRDKFSLQCSSFRRSVERNIPLTASERDRWQQEVGAYRELWTQMELAASNLPAHRDMLEAVARGRRMTAETQIVMSAVLNGLSGIGGAGEKARDWSDNCARAYGPILGIGHAALDIALQRAAADERFAYRVGAISTVILFMALVFGTVTLLFIKRRLTVPLASLVSSLQRLESGDYQQPIAASAWHDEPAMIGTTLESLRQKVLNAERLRARLDRLRDDLVEQARQTSRAKSQFLAMMSHEIRTPLNGLLGAAQLLRATRLTAAQKGWVAALDTSGHLLLAIVTDILDYSRISSGRATVERVGFKPTECIAAVEANIRSAAQAKGLSYTSTIATDVPRHLTGDPAKLSQILLNILGNAVKFTESGSLDLSVSIDRSAPSASLAWLRFVIADTGIGIPDLARASLFEPFTQADGSISRRFGGSGLGLSICKGLTGLLGGTIEFVCPPSGGTIFTVRLPFSLIDNASEESGIDREMTVLPRLNVLVAEDNEVNSSIIRQLLLRTGHIATLVRDGQTALDMAANTDFDIVLMDLSMPGLDGIETTRRIRALQHQVRSMVPVIAITADLSAERRLADQPNLFDGFIGKPYCWTDLEQKMAGLLGILPSRPSPAEAQSKADHVLTQHIRDLGVEWTSKIVELYLSETPAMADRLRIALAAGKMEDIAEIAHRMRGSAAHLGADAIALLAADIEQKAAGDDRAATRIAVRLLLQRLETELSLFEAISAAELQRENSVAVANIGDDAVAV
jgi:signal transduction histidine kinase/CheY-like chemotaxis protein/HPt (histidine-containing phosphotransfer) domain-containing protein